MLIFGTLRSTSTDTLPISDLDGSIRIPDLPDAVSAFGTPLREGMLGRIDVVYTVDPTPQVLTAVAPGLTYDVVFAVGTTERDLPDTLAVELWAKTYRISSIEERMIWTDDTLSTVVELPLSPSGVLFQPIWELQP
ncbi:hypothetical protein [Ornithinimicrobium sp. Y1694]|uniref:hypothetical protein n=1 Tax=Ornithinimicrobium sp. Y1694 TaxID=3418590 RepID=UPI003CF5B11B